MPKAATSCPSSQAGTDFVAALYAKILGRTVHAQRLGFWSTALNNLGGVSSSLAKATVAAQLITIVTMPLTSRPDGLTDAIHYVQADGTMLVATAADAITAGLGGTGLAVRGSIGADTFVLTGAQLAALPTGFSLNGRQRHAGDRGAPRA